MPDPWPIGGIDAEAAVEADGVWSRDELSQYLEHEQITWYKERWGQGALPIPEPCDIVYQLPKYWSDSEKEAEMFKAMEQLPCTTIGMWLFPAEALPEPVFGQINAYNLSALRPSLLLFQV